MTMHFFLNSIDALLLSTCWEEKKVIGARGVAAGIPSELCVFIF